MHEPFISFVKREIMSDAVLITCGLPATNKTGTALVIARIKGLTILRTDLIRRQILREEEIFDERTASDMGRRTLVYEQMFLEAEVLAAQGKGIILDATFVTQHLRRRAAAVAANSKRAFFIEQTVAPEPFSLERISRRSREKDESNALTEAAYLDNKNRFEPVDLDDLKGLYPGLSIVHFIVDTASEADGGWYVIGRAVR